MAGCIDLVLVRHYLARFLSFLAGAHLFAAAGVAVVRVLVQRRQQGRGEDH